MDHKDLATLARLVYREPGEPEALWRDSLHSRLLDHNFRLRGVVDRRDTQAMVVACRSSGQLAIVFRGTEPLRGVDVETCKQFSPREDVHGSVHRGFAHALDAVYFDLRSMLRPSDRVYLTGHSMGGALAIVMASRIIREHRIAGLVTFGAPPCVRPELARMLSRFLNGSCVRYEAADLVTMLMRTIYAAPGHLYYLTCEGHIIERAGRWVSWADRMKVIGQSIAARWAALRSGRIRQAFGMPRLIIGHSMERYEKAVHDNAIIRSAEVEYA